MFALSALLCIAFSFVSCSTSHHAPEKSFPITAVEWEEDLPKVQFNNRWMYVEGVDHLTVDTILAYCKKEYGEI